MTRIGACAAALGAASGVALAQAPLLGVSFRDGNFAGNAAIYDVDPLTGEATNQRQTGADVLNGIAFAPDGRLLSFTDSFGNVNGNSVGDVLVELDPATGATTVIGSLGLSTFSEGDLDFNPVTGELFGVVSSAGSSALITINPATGAATQVGAMPADDASAMAFTDDGRLFVLDTSFSFPTIEATLYEIDPATGAEIAAFDTGVALGNVAGMDFDPITGQLFMADGDNDGTDLLYTIDITNGALTPIGDTMAPGFFGGLAGLEFIPAPGSLGVLAMGGVLASRRRRG